jgi:hypothetical protein
MVVIAPYLQARRGRHASLYLTRLGSPASKSARDPRAASLLDIRRRLDALRRCHARQASVARSNALLFACLLRHGAPDPHQAIVLRWFVRHARLTVARHSPLSRARRGLRLRVTGVLAAWHLAPRTVVWWLDQHSSASFVAALTWTAPSGGWPPASSVSHGMVRSLLPAIPVALLICSSDETHQWSSPQ